MQGNAIHIQIEVISLKIVRTSDCSDAIGITIKTPPDLYAGRHFNCIFSTDQIGFIYFFFSNVKTGGGYRSIGERFVAGGNNHIFTAMDVTRSIRLIGRVFSIRLS